MYIEIAVCVCVCVCVCVSKREREEGRQRKRTFRSDSSNLSDKGEEGLEVCGCECGWLCVVCVCWRVWVCVLPRSCVCVCVCVFDLHHAPEGYRGPLTHLEELRLPCIQCERAHLRAVHPQTPAQDT